MSNQMKHLGLKPEQIFIVSIPAEKVFWIYLKEGHAINRMLKERTLGKAVTMSVFCEPPEEDNKVATVA
jgi:hypothetical protein